jgi:hypothetical protein
MHHGVGPKGLVDMKECNKCKRSMGSLYFRTRSDGFAANTCRACQAAECKERREKKKAAAGIPPPRPSLPPLENAYAEAKIQQEKRDLKKEHSALLDENKHLKQSIEELIAFKKPPTVHVYKESKWTRSDATVMGIASDWHVEEPVDKASVHGLNEYNLDIAKSRAERFFRNLLRLADGFGRDSTVRTLYIPALGDFFSGWIHEELVANGLLPPGDAARFCKSLWFSGIDFLLKESSYVLESDMIPGNHGRMTHKVHFGDPTGTSLESVMYDAIVDRYHNNPRVRFNVSKQAVVYRKFYEKFIVRALHGYEMKYGGGVGGITIPVLKALAQWDQGVKADLTIFGHFHQRIDGGRFLANGSMIGMNLFAQAIKASYEPPQQTVCLITARNGGEKALTGPIWLDDAKG